MTWIVNTKCVLIEPKKKALRAHNRGKDAENKTIWEVEYEDLGWFAHFEGSHESIHLGFDKPDMLAGDEIEITIKVTKPVPR